MKVDRITRCGDIIDFSVIFLLPAEVLVTDSESQTPISYSYFSDYGSTWLGFSRHGYGTDRRQTNDYIAY